MATVFKRDVFSYRGEEKRQTGTSWTANYQDRDGKWKMKAVPATATPAKTEKAQQRQAQDWANGYEKERQKAPIAPVAAPELCSALMDKWIATITNRSDDDDRSRYHLHVRPAFAGEEIRAVDVAMVMKWIDAQRAATAPRGGAPIAEGAKPKRGRKPKAGRLSDASIRHNLNLLSRFFSWAVMRGHVAANPVRSIPTKARPQQAPKRDAPYLRDDVLVRKLLGRLPLPIDLMFYIGHTSGLRLGEIAGLRMSDVDKLSGDDTATIRASHSYDSCLKEDKHETGLSKLVPVGGDAERLLRPWIDRRLAQGAQPTDYLFNNPGGGHYRAVFIERAWRKAAKACDVDLTWYSATRHSFTSRLLEAGNSIDEVSAALNHSSPVVTARYYHHYKREKFSPSMRLTVDVGNVQPDGGKTLPFKQTA